MIKYLVILTLIFLSCKKNQKETTIDSLTDKYRDSLAFNEVVKKLHEVDEVLWSDKNIEIYVHHSIIEEGEEKLVI